MLNNPIPLDQFEHKDKVLTLINKSDNSYARGKKSPESKLIYSIIDLIDDPYLVKIYAKRFKSELGDGSFNISNCGFTVVYTNITCDMEGIYVYGKNNYILMNNTVYPIKDRYDLMILNNDLQTMIVLDNI